MRMVCRCRRRRGHAGCQFAEALASSSFFTSAICRVLIRLQLDSKAPTTSSSTAVVPQPEAQFFRQRVDQDRSEERHTRRRGLEQQRLDEAVDDPSTIDRPCAQQVRQRVRGWHQSEVGTGAGRFFVACSISLRSYSTLHEVADSVYRDDCGVDRRRRSGYNGATVRRSTASRTLQPAARTTTARLGSLDPRRTRRCRLQTGC